MKTFSVAAAVVVLGCAGALAQAHRPKSFAQNLVDTTLAKHPAATEVGISAHTRGGCRGIASTDPGDVGEKCEAEDVAAMNSGRAAAVKESDGYDVSLPLHDAAGGVVGAVGIEFRLTAVGSRAAALSEAGAIEQEMAAQIQSPSQLTAAAGAAAEKEPLRLLARAAMPAAVRGRFDHLTTDAVGNRLFVAAESAHEVLIFNLRTLVFERALTGIGIPHAVLVRHDLDRIYVTDGGAGAVKVYDGSTYQLLGSVALKVDADSIGYDPASHLLYVDNGGGDAHETFSMFSAINTDRDTKAWEIKVDGDTLEAMALAPDSALIYVNDRAKNQVSVIDRSTHALIEFWPVTMAKVNVAMALDEADHRLFLGCRSGAIVVMDTQGGRELQALPIPTGVDDLIYDAGNHRLYAATATGTIAVYEQQPGDHYISLGEVSAAPGSKNETLAQSLHRLYTAVPTSAGHAGSVFVFAVQ